MKKNQELTSVIIAKNEERMLPTCLETLKWCKKIIVIDNGSTDKTAAIAEEHGAKVISFSHPSFARLRNEALKYVQTNWVLYIDADERVTTKLANEISVAIETNPTVSAMSLYRNNVCYGTEFLHGGWEKDKVTRIFKMSSFKNWTGVVHESPEFSGEAVVLVEKLQHFTHRNTKDGLKKTIVWTDQEAQLLADSSIGKVSFFTILRKASMEFLRRAILWKGYKDGTPGLIEALVQGINRAFVYIQVWEKQQTASLEEQYHRLDMKIVGDWKRKS